MSQFAEDHLLFKASSAGRIALTEPDGEGPEEGKAGDHQPLAFVHLIQSRDF